MLMPEEPTPLRPPEISDHLHTIRSLAEDKAQEDAQNDIAEGNEASEAEVQEKARQAWNTEDRRNQVFIEAFSRVGTDRTRGAYFETYTRRYQQAIEEQSASILDETTGDLRRLAQNDKKQYAEILPQEYVFYHAAFCVQPYAKQSPLDRLAYLKEIHDLTSRYMYYYNKYTPRQGRDDRSNRSTPFPDSW